MAKPKFNIGDTVYNKVTRRGSYEPSVCTRYEKLDVDAVKRDGDSYVYTCGYDGYMFREDELMSPEEYARMIAKG